MWSKIYWIFNKYKKNVLKKLKLNYKYIGWLNKHWTLNMYIGWFNKHWTINISGDLKTFNYKLYRVI